MGYASTADNMVKKRLCNILLDTDMDLHHTIWMPGYDINEKCQRMADDVLTTEKDGNRKQRALCA